MNKRVFKKKKIKFVLNILKWFNFIGYYRNIN